MRRYASLVILVFVCLASTVRAQLPAPVRAAGPEKAETRAAYSFERIRTRVRFETAQAPADVRIASIKVTGIKRYAPADVTRLSGLEIGKPATNADLAAAANALAATGLFNSVKYSYTTAGRQMTVTLDVEEAAWTVPVVFDNFVAIPDQELTAEVRKAVPSFDGTAPVNTGAADFLARALQEILKGRGVPGRVEFGAQADIRKPGSISYVFAVKDPSPKVCALHATGASAIPEKELLEPLASVVGSDYSRLFVTTASNGTLRDMYRRRGHWRAAFAPPSVALDACAGVAVTLNVTEGPAFAWERAEWTGNAALPSAALDKALAMKAGDTADATKIETGLRQVRDAYGTQGHIFASASYEPRLDEASRKAVFAFTVEEGPQFRMGRLEFVGLRDSDAEMLAKRFRLKPGDVYDASYVKEYQSKELFPLRTTGGTRAMLETHPDRENRVVNLKVVFK